MIGSATPHSSKLFITIACVAVAAASVVAVPVLVTASTLDDQTADLEAPRRAVDETHAYFWYALTLALSHRETRDAASLHDLASHFALATHEALLATASCPAPVDEVGPLPQTADDRTAAASEAAVGTPTVGALALSCAEAEEPAGVGHEGRLGWLRRE